MAAHGRVGPCMTVVFTRTDEAVAMIGLKALSLIYLRGPCLCPSGTTNRPGRARAGQPDQPGAVQGAYAGTR
jgi:hypothetical protein